MTVTRFQQKRGTTAEWAARTTPLLDGEIGVDKDTGVIKMGDGFTMWVDLDPIMDSQYLPILGKAHDSYRLEGLQAADFLLANGKAVDADKLDGHDSTYFLSTTGTAADSAKLGGQLPAFYMAASAAGSFLPVAGKAADADKLDGIDSTGFVTTSQAAAITAPTSPTRTLVNHWGAATSFPSSGMLQGDTVVRSDVGTGGSLWVYVGPGKGSGGWVHKGPIVCTAATRPASGVLYAGLEIYETDTGRDSYYDGSKWQNGALGLDRSLNGTADVLGGASFEVGMAKFTGNGTGAQAVTVTFPVTFASRPLFVFVNPFGYVATVGAFNAASPTTNWEGWNGVGGETTTTQMTARFRRNDGSIFSSTTDYYFNWLAVGQK